MAAKRKRKRAPVLEAVHQRPGHIVTGEAFEAGRRVVQRRVQDALDRLIERGALSRRQGMAGERLRDDYMLGVEGARNSDKSGSGRPDWGPGDAQLAALQACRAARDRLGPHRWPIVIHVVAGMTLAEVAAQRNEDPKRIAGVLACSLDDLADGYGLPYDAGRPGVAGVMLKNRLDPVSLVR